MTQTLLRFLNTPILIFLVAIGLAVQSSLFTWWPLNYLQPDVVLLLVVWCALRRGFEEGGVVTLIIAEMAEIHSAAPSGAYLIAYMLVYLGVRAASRFLVIPSLASLASITLGSAVAFRLIVLVILFLLGSGLSPIRHSLSYLFLGAAVEALLALKVFRWLEEFDRITYKNQRSDQVADELQLDSEGW